MVTKYIFTKLHSDASSILYKALHADQIFSKTLKSGGFLKTTALVLMHQIGWTLQRLSRAKELQEESESLEAANLSLPSHYCQQYDLCTETSR